MTMWSSVAEGAEMEAAPLSSIRDQNQVHAHLPCTRLPASPHHQTRAELILSLVNPSFSPERKTPTSFWASWTLRTMLNVGKV